MKVFSTVLLCLAAAGILSGCDQSGPERAAAKTAPVDASTSMDESRECGQIAYLMAAFPTQNSVEGIAESYRGCDSQISAQLQYVDDDAQVVYSLSVLTPEQAGLSPDNGSWSELVQSNVLALSEIIATQRSPADGSERTSQDLLLPNGATGVIYHEAGEWSLVAILNDRHALRIDASKDDWNGFDSEQALALMKSLVGNVNFAGL
ncbi:MAG: hypothetical protein ACK4SX_04755 [Alcanivoracaceae bacterium]